MAQDNLSEQFNASFPKEHDSEKIRRFLIEQYPELSEEKIEELTSRHAEFGLLMVRLWMKKHPRLPENGPSTEFDEKDKSPPE